MSSVRIAPHNRPAAAPLGAASESGRADTRSGGASFSATLGAAAAPGATLSAAQAAEAATASRKRTGKDDKGGDPAATLAAQDAVLAAAAGQAASLPPDAAHPGHQLGIATDGDAQIAGTPGAAQAVVTSQISTLADVPGGGVSSILLRPAALIAAAPAEVKAVPVTAADASTADPEPADATAMGPEVSAALGPGLQPAPNTTPAQNLPAGLAELVQALPAGQPGAGNGDPMAGGENRRGSGFDLVASEGTRATEAAALGASGNVPALANAPTAASMPATLVGANSTASISDQVAGHVVRLVTSGSRDMVMRLHPPELGEVTVRVAVNGRDVSAWFGSPQPQVQTAITDAIGQLQAGLGNAGYNLNGAWVGADASGARQQTGSLPLPTVAAATAPAADFGITAASQPSASGLNIYV